MSPEVTVADVIRQNGDYIVLLLEKDSRRLVGIRAAGADAFTARLGTTTAQETVSNLTARPGDAIAMALLAKAPIRVDL